MLGSGLSWLENFRRTKIFDLLAASPLILWYLLGLRRQVPITLLRLQELINGTIILLAFLPVLTLVLFLASGCSFNRGNVASVLIEKPARGRRLVV
jgi:hypothetical protein